MKEVNAQAGRGVKGTPGRGRVQATWWNAQVGQVVWVTARWGEQCG